MDDKKYLINTLKKINREGTDGLISYMEEFGFFTAPCSGGNHLCEEGGLLKHTRNVMELAEKIGVAFLGGEEYNKIHESVMISAALHDLGKIGQFGKPEYIENILASGKPSDKKPFKRNPELLNVPHEIRSVAIATMYIDLTEEEQHAILYHNGKYTNTGYTLDETPIQMIVHFADLWCSRVIEV